MKQDKILDNVVTRLGITHLNEFQLAVIEHARSLNDNLLLYAPTGSGKTLAYVLPTLEVVEANNAEPQLVVICPSRELTLQVYGVYRSVAEGVKITCCYGGHSVEDERRSLQSSPSIIVATPGRLLDHVRRHNTDLSSVHQIVIDEFDKCLELGFSDEMRRLIAKMPRLSRRILASATQLECLPAYVGMQNAVTVDYTKAIANPLNRMTVIKSQCTTTDKQIDLFNLLATIRANRVIVFTNDRECAKGLNTYLCGKHVDCVVYHGGLDQVEREKAVAMFRNGSVLVLVATDLASRGLDIDNVKTIIHFDIPVSPEAYIHRNGRTARVDARGEVYVMLGHDDACPEFIQFDSKFTVPGIVNTISMHAPMTSLYFGAGRKEKISRGDIVGFIVGNSELQACDVGRVDVYDHYALVAVPRPLAQGLVELLNAARIKGKRVRISIARQRLNE